MSAPDLSALNAENVRISTTGALWKAPLGSTVPGDSDPFAALDAAFKNLGYVSDDGVNEDYDDSTEDIVAWQGATTVRTAITQSTTSLELTLIEEKGAVLEAFFKGSQIVNVSDQVWKMEVKPITADPSIFILDTLDGPIYTRTIFGNSEIVQRGTVENMSGGARGYPVTIRAYPDANDTTLVKYSNNAAWGYS